MAAGFRSLCKSKLENPQFHMKKNMEHGWNMDGTWMELDCLAQKDYQQLFLPCVGESNFFATRRKDRSLPRMKNQV